ncbi:MAG: DUF421 domain-containing protein [Atopobium sp.]|jgi:uncharacterized membrane protein YcaP (DUF421 family)|nr:DUF421 domain-containing protein [Atopobium sp.]
MEAVSSALLHYVSIAGSTAIVYLFIILCMRVFGKTEVAQLSITDFVFIMLISNAVQNAMVGPDTSLEGGLVAAMTLFVIDSLFKCWRYRFPRLADKLQGSPLTLVRHGKVQQQAMRLAMLTQDELMEALREHGVSKLDEVDMAVLETDGAISVLSDQFKTQTTRKRQPRRPAKKRG